MKLHRLLLGLVLLGIAVSLWWQPAPVIAQGKMPPWATAARPDPVVGAGAAREAQPMPAPALAPVPLRLPSAGRFGDNGPTQLGMLPPGDFGDQLARLRPEVRQAVLAQLDQRRIPLNDFNSLGVSPAGELFYSCASPGPVAPPKVPTAMLATAASDVAPTTEQTDSHPEVVPNTSPPIRHSRPGASRVIYLDFNGHTITGTAWNEQYGVASYSALPYDINNRSGRFNEEEQAIIIGVWERVAEDFAPFDVDVTTEEPAVFTNTTARALITHGTDANGVVMPHGNTSAGTAYLNVFGTANYATRYSPVLIYAERAGMYSAGDLAAAVSHELGHTFGLSHDGVPGNEYYAGHGSGATSWAPIMGASYGKSVTQWSKGEYLNATNLEDDYALISAKLPYRPDEAGDTTATAAPLTVTVAAVSASSVIERAGDADCYSFFTEASPVSFSVMPYRDAVAGGGGNLDIRLELLDAAGNLVTAVDPAAETNATLSTSLARGAYYLKVTGVGAGSPPASGYTSYGSRGQYTITGSILPSSGPAPVITSSLNPRLVARGTYFEYQIVATNSPSAYNATGLPPGLHVNQTTGWISGYSYSPGRYGVNIAAANVFGTARETLIIEIADAPAITSSLRLAAARDQPFSYQIAATYSPTAYNATGLPPGVSVDQSTGLISGTPTSNGVFDVLLAAANTLGSTQIHATMIVSSSAPVISSAFTATAERNRSFSYQVTADNLPVSYNAVGLPSGLTINPSTGLISGTTSGVAGTYLVQLTAANAVGTHQVLLNLSVIRPVTLSSNPEDQVVAPGATASFSVVATSEEPLSYQWRFQGVDLPGATGATLTIANAQLANAGDYDVRISNSAQSIVSRSALLAIRTPEAALSDFDGDGLGDILLEHSATGSGWIWYLRRTDVLSTGSFIGSEGWHLAGSGDFNADGRADLVLQNTLTGARQVRLMSGYGSVDTAVALPTLPVAWQFACVGDLNRDGKPDIVLQNTETNDRIIWLMNGANIVSSVALPTIPVSWQICGLIDFTGDAQADVLLQNTITGERVIWVLDAQYGIARSIGLPTLPLVWRFGGVGRFSSDALPNIILQNTVTGDCVLWSINPDGTIARSHGLRAVDLGWNIAGPMMNRALTAGLHDLSGDGRSDIVVTNTITADRVIWAIDQGTITGSIGLPTWTTDQRFAGMGDFNGDGVNDLVVQNEQAGDIDLWLCDGAGPRVPVATASAFGFKCAGVVDVNRDGHPDILLQNLSTGERVVRLMNFTVARAVLKLPTLPVSWIFAGGGNFTADGKANLLLENTSTGDRLFWTLNSDGSIAQSVGLPTFLGGWRFAGTGDFNADGHVDILLQNTQTGDRVIWAMNRTSIAGSIGLPWLPTSWTLRD